MRTLRRRLLACLTILSLLLCLATVGLWVRSYWRWDVHRYSARAPSGTRLVSVSSAFGELFARVSKTTGQISNAPEPELGWSHYTERDATNDIRTRWVAFGAGDRVFWFIGFGYLFHTPNAGSTNRFICVPHWFLALLFAILPAIHLRSILRNRRRFGAGLCPACGYDLRATPDRCPECGKAPARGAET